MQASKESALIKMQSIFEYLYDSFVNKYGLINFAEKKLNEVLLSVTKNRTIPKIELFARFLGIGESYYTPDDLDFFFTLGLLFQNATFGFNFKKDALALDAAPYANQENIIELLNQFFRDKASYDKINKTFQDVL